MINMIVIINDDIHDKNNNYHDRNYDIDNDCSNDQTIICHTVQFRRARNNSRSPVTRRKRSLIESNFLQLIYHFLNLTTKLDYVSLFHKNIHILNHNPHFLSTFRSFGKDIMEH